MGDLKRIAITGANQGLGFECAKTLAKESKSNQIVMACRSLERAQEARKQIISETGNENIDIVELDLSSLESVRKGVAQIIQEGLVPIDVLVLNAGIGGRHSGISPDGFELIFATNHLGHFLLTLLLLPHITDPGRILTVSSAMNDPRPHGRLAWPGAAALAAPNEDQSRYSYSKLCNLYFAYELSRRLARLGKKITVNAFNPGLMVETNFTGLPRDGSRIQMDNEGIGHQGYVDVSGAALAAMAIDDYHGKESAKYNDRGTIIDSSPLSHNKENALDLWEASIKYSGIMVGETVDGVL
ncbi:MAG: SDR family NAD(P)-dependent oxidoreductase [Eubacteriaceae bacterium]|nr:SDR family NAD(P)-dependent oxidoreductase [Eubacteriaceae bacterium]